MPTINEKGCGLFFRYTFVSFPEDLSLKEEKVKTLVSWSSFWLVFQTISLREAQSH